jgi:hypothetical protein
MHLFAALLHFADLRHYFFAHRMNFLQIVDKHKLVHLLAIGVARSNHTYL